MASGFKINANTREIILNLNDIFDGGATDQVLIKASATDYDFDWGAIPAGTLNDLTDVDLTGAANNDILYRSGGNWIDSAGLLTWDGNLLKAWDTGGTDHIRISHDGGDSHIFSDNAVDLEITGHSGTIRIPSGSGMAMTTVNHTGFSMHRLNLADDATTTITLGQYSAVLIKTNLNQTADFAAFITSQQAPLVMAQGSAVSYGNSANPDVDGNANYWKASTTTFSIKNRLDSTRAFTVYIFNAN
jgi:hypothetical protein